jgi:PAS domain S-box-containing protein
MLQSVLTIFRGPQLIDPDKMRIVQLVRAMTLTYFVVTFFVCVFFAYLMPEKSWVSLTIFIIVATLSISSLCLLKQKRIQAASHLLTFSFFLGLLFNGYFYGGIRSINGPAFIILLIIAGLLLGTHTLRQYTFISIVAIVTLYYLEVYGLVENSVMEPVQTTDLGIAVAAISIASLLLHAAIGSIDKGYWLLNNALHELKSTTVSKTYVENIIASMQDMLFVITPEARIEMLNQAVVDLLGYRESELIGQPLQIVLAPAERPLWHQATLNSTLFSLRHQEVKFLARDGRVIETAVSTALMKDENSDTHNIVCVANDITQRKQFEAELKAAKELAEEATKAKSEFLASMSHEIRTPLNAVIGMTSLLLDTPLTPEQEDYVSTARTSGNGLLAIINDILDFSKIDSGRLELEQQAFILRECVEEAIDLLAVQATQKNLYLNSFIEPDVPAIIQSDVTRLRQILVNLLGNAVKFTAEGEINLWVGSKQQNGQTEIQFMVSDTGIGIPEDRRNRLFHPFRQGDSSTTRKFGGTGLGLAISKSLVKMMGGDIWVESSPNEGSIFYFTIQAEIIATPPDTNPVSANAQPLEFASKRVLVGHPNQTSRIVLSRQLRQWGIGVACASSVPEILQTLTQSPRFDLVILDTAILENNDALLEQSIRQAAISNPLLLVTPLGQQFTVSEKYASCYYLNRPYHMNQLYQQLTLAFSHEVGNGRSQPITTPTKSQFNKAQGSEHPLRILLAEDNLINQKVALRMLERLGYNADVAANGREAVEALTRQPYDLILMDIQMPEMDGMQATQQIRRGWLPNQQPRIVAMTANALAGDRETYLASGMDDYVSKPVKIEELTRVLQLTSPVVG